jgi:hypothetical protein
VYISVFQRTPDVFFLDLVTLVVSGEDISCLFEVMVSQDSDFAVETLLAACKTTWRVSATHRHHVVRFRPSGFAASITTVIIIVPSRCGSIFWVSNVACDRDTAFSPRLNYCPNITFS